jgi:hypothetical protein
MMSEIFNSYRLYTQKNQLSTFHVVHLASREMFYGCMFYGCMFCGCKCATAKLCKIISQSQCKLHETRLSFRGTIKQG